MAAANYEQLEASFSALLRDLLLGPASLARHPSADSPLSEASRLPGLGTRTSNTVARTGVSLAFLRGFYERVVEPQSAGNPHVTTKEVVERFVKPLSKGWDCLALRLPSAAVSEPTAFVSHAWGTCHAYEERTCECAPGAGSFAELVASVSDYFRGASLLASASPLH